MLLLCAGAFSQVKAQNPYNLPEDPKTKRIGYTEVVNLPGTTKDKLFERAQKSIKAMYKVPKVETSDKENGRLLLKCSTAVVLKDKKSGMDVQEGYILYKCEISLKEGRYKYDFYDFHKDEGGFKMTLEKWMDPTHNNPKDRLAEKAVFLDNDIKKKIATLKENMSTEKVQVKEDW